jgi:ACS family allantoate permease-like MFS transporter
MEQDTVRPRGISRSLHSDEVEKGSSKVEQEEVVASSKESAITATVTDGDEALQLVGAVRKDIFDDEFNAKLRRKLDRYIPTVCAAVYFTQFLDKNTLAYAR